MKNYKHIGELRVFADTTELDDQTIDERHVYIAAAEVIFHNDKYYELKLTFPDGSFRKLFIPQSSRLAKIDYKTAK